MGLPGTERTLGRKKVEMPGEARRGQEMPGDAQQSGFAGEVTAMSHMAEYRLT